MTTQSNTSNQPEYLVATYRGGKITEERMTRDEKAKLNPEDVDFHCDDSTGQFRIQREDGTALDYFADLPQAGETHRRLLLDLMWQPGQLLCPQKLFRGLRGAPRYLRSLLIARLARLRRAFGESAEKPWYFLTRRSPYSVCWNAKRSWRFVERLAQADGGDQGQPVTTP